MLIVFPPNFVVETKIIYGYNFVPPSIWVNSLIVKVLSRSFIMLNTMMENESKSFTNISIEIS